MITFKTGDMFSIECDAIVNTVNCFGAMGKGVAKEFKNRWYDNFLEYKKLCDKKAIKIGKMFVFENTKSGLKYLINFPTKNHWRYKSKLSYIDSGLDDLIDQIVKLEIKSIVIPPLGCGNGGLDWNVVKELIEEKLSILNDVEIIVYNPNKDIT